MDNLDVAITVAVGAVFLVVGSSLQAILALRLSLRLRAATNRKRALAGVEAKALEDGVPVEAARVDFEKEFPEVTVDKIAAQESVDDTLNLLGWGFVFVGTVLVAIGSAGAVFNVP